MADFFTFMHSVNHKAETVVTDEKPEVKKEVECGLCMTEKDKKAGECKFDKGASKPVRDALMGYLEGEEDTEEKPDGEIETKSEVMVGEDSAPWGKFDESKHPRESKGGEGGGRFKTSNKTIEEQDYVPNFKEGDFVEFTDGTTWRVGKQYGKPSKVLECWQFPGHGMSMIDERDLKPAKPSIKKLYEETHSATTKDAAPETK